MAVSREAMREWIEAAQARRAFLQEQEQRLLAERKSYTQEAERLGELLARTRQELVGHLLPDLDDEALAALERRFSYAGGLLPIKRRIEEQLATVAREKAALERTDEVRNLDFHLSRAADERAELKETYTALKAELQLWLDNRHWQALVTRGWFSPGYRTGLLGWLRDWRAVSFLMTMLEYQQPGKKYRSAAALRDAYAHLRATADPVFEAYEDLGRRQEHLRELKARYEALGEAPAKLMQELYAELGRAIQGHFEALPDDARQSLAGDDRDLALYLTKERGLTKQIDYLKELTVTRLDAPLQTLAEQQSRLGAKLQKMQAKLARGKLVAVEPGQLASLRDLKRESWEKRHSGLSSLRTRIGGFDDYSRGSYRDDFLWWGLMTHNARADDLYEVRTFYERNPGWDHRQYQAGLTGGTDAALDQAAVSLADEMGDGFGDGSRLLDAS